ncbi:hypothetical protein AVEN_141314-1 [Araneus ventricosus]|uniref:Uncharacterized protein n=1 Tax=Araneus ventricosus TaxID=182803 RepID=A0A4Y2SUC4_ARAVE|nr:hypothetical protein AVEN_141314-1 [Araneus ventricosus]
MWKREGGGNEFGQCFGYTRLEIERILSVEDMKPRITKKKTILMHSNKQNKLLISVSMFHEEDGLKIEKNQTNTERRLTCSLECVLTSFPLSSPIVCRQERERVPEHLFWMRVENFFGVVCACADRDLFTGLRLMPLISPHCYWSTVCSLLFDGSAYEFEYTTSLEFFDHLSKRFFFNNRSLLF